jgi:hypothetical protein
VSWEKQKVGTTRLYKRQCLHLTLEGLLLLSFYYGPQFLIESAIQCMQCVEKIIKVINYNLIIDSQKKKILLD